MLVLHSEATDTQVVVAAQSWRVVVSTRRPAVSDVCVHVTALTKALLYAHEHSSSPSGKQQHF